MIRFFLNPNDDETNENRRLSGAKILPNILTIAALCIGLTALRFGVEFKWTNAMLLVLIAAVLDGLDGMVARLLKASSPFGAELDSLSDFVSFGVVPSVLLYQWSLRDADPFGWVASLLLCVAVALRLARFNVKNSTPAASSETPATQKSFFEGVPAPAGAILALVPMMVGFKIYSDDPEGAPNSYLVAIWVIFIAGLMVSRLPTFSLKRLRLRQRHTFPILVLAALFASALASEPWLTLILCSLGYLASIPYAVKRYKLMYETPTVAVVTPEAQESTEEFSTSAKENAGVTETI
ncbi:MAG: pssA [Alphaproteobacteria bacterium]|nr:pssA [Alphaproteobacteria bacterium]